MQPWERIWVWAVVLAILTFLNVESEPAASQRSFLQNLSKVDQFVQIRSSLTKKFIHPEGEERLTSPDASTVTEVSLVQENPLQVWRIRQTVGFPFRDGKFSPVYKISSKDSTNIPFHFSQMLWFLKPSQSSEDEYQLVKPYEDYKCLSEEIGSQVITLGLCNDTTKNTMWKFATIPL